VSPRAHAGDVVTLRAAGAVYTERAHAIGAQILFANLDGNAFAAALLSQAIEGWLVEHAGAVGLERLDDLARRLVPSQSGADSAPEPRTPSPTVARAGNALDRLPVRELEPRRPTRRPGGARTPRATTPGDSPDA